MTEPIILAAKDRLIRQLNFKPYRSNVRRRVRRFLPGPGEPQSLQVETPWGETLTAQPGDYLVSELDDPEDRWPVAADLFEKTYLEISPGICVKRALTELAPLVDITDGDPDREVLIYTIEGQVTVRAGDFYLARGARKEIWPYPKEKIGCSMILVGE